MFSFNMLETFTTPTLPTLSSTPWSTTPPPPLPTPITPHPLPWPQLSLTSTSSLSMNPCLVKTMRMPKEGGAPPNVKHVNFKFPFIFLILDDTCKSLLICY